MTFTCVCVCARVCMCVCGVTGVCMYVCISVYVLLLAVA